MFDDFLDHFIIKSIWINLENELLIIQFQKIAIFENRIVFISHETKNSY
jgi:hypothetical protein